MTKGYEPPGTLPESTKCLLVFYPDDQERFFSRALRGHLLALQSSWMWASDDYDYRKQVAYLWLLHNQRTFDVWDNMDCELANLIETGEDMNINVSVNGGCGCGCGCGSSSGNPTQEFIDLSQQEGFDPFPSEPTMAAEDELNDLCDAAHQWAGGVSETMQRMKSFFAGTTVTVTSVTTFLASILKVERFRLLLAPAAFFQILLASIALAISTNVTDEANDAAQEHEGDFVCAIFSASTPAQAKANVLAVIAEIRANYGILVASLFYALAQITDWRKVTIENDGLILPEYVGSDCVDCLNPDTDAYPLGGGYWLIPVTGGTVKGETNAAWEYVGGNTWRLTIDAAENFYLESFDLSPFGFDWDADSGSHRYGYQMDVLHSQSGKLHADVTSLTIHGESDPWVMTDGRYRGAIDSLASWQDEELVLPYPVAGDGALGSARDEIKLVNTFDSPTTVIVDISLWVVMDEGGMV